jgi:hypothetical protein
LPYGSNSASCYRRPRSATASHVFAALYRPVSRQRFDLGRRTLMMRVAIVDGLDVALLADVVDRRGAGVRLERGDPAAVLVRVALDRPGPARGGWPAAPAWSPSRTPCARRRDATAAAPA